MAPALSAINYPQGPATCPTRCYIPPSDGAVVPIKEEIFGFRRLLYDRQRAFMTMELFHIREGLMGSDALIESCLKSASPGGQLKLNVNQRKLSDLMPNDMDISLLVELLKSYVRATAWSDSAQRWAGNLPPAQTYAKGEILLGCACEGKVFNQGAVLRPLRKGGNRQVDWSKFLDWAESMVDTGKAAPEPRDALRKRLQLSLEKLDLDFLKAMDLQFDRFGFPMHDSHMLKEEHGVRKLMDKVPPLPAKLAKGLDKWDPFDYSMDQLEALRKNGREALESVARMRRNEGNDLFNRAKTLSGAEEEKVLAEAEAKYMSTIPSGGFEGVASSGNLSALHLKKKNYEQTIVFASNVPTRFADMHYEPKDYATYRWRMIKSFIAGNLAEVPNNKTRKVPMAEEKQMYTIMYKCFGREGKANLALCQAALVGHGKISPANLQKPKERRSKAIECYQKMQGVPCTPDAPMQDIEALEKTFNARMSLHEKACSGRR